MPHLTPSSLRLDLKCGKGSISTGEKCHKGKSAALTAGAVAGAALGAYGIYHAMKGRGPRHLTGPLKPYLPDARVTGYSRGRPQLPPSLTPNRVLALPGKGTSRQLTGFTPKGLLPFAKPKLSKTQRMRANTEASIKNAERQIAQTAREEVRRLGQIGNTMASAGEAAGNATKLTARNVRLRVEALRRQLEPGYRNSLTSPRRSVISNQPLR